jgi:gliding motility-associated-like protein
LGKKEVFTTENLSYTFPQFGRYKGIMIANPGQKPCTDTAKFIINIFPEIKADFEYKYDTCVAGPIIFTNTSFTGSKQFRQYLWKFGDGGISYAKDPIYTFKKPGKYDVELTVLDTNGCKTGRKRTINYFPAPAVIIIEPSSFKGCVPLSVFFNNLSTPIDSTYKIEWTFGEGGTSSKISPTYTYNKIGTFDVGIKITTPIGCKASAFYPQWITVRPGPVAAFECNPETVSNLNPTVSFTEKAKDAVAWSWRMGKEFSTNLRNPTYTFKDTGIYIVKLTVRHPNGCLDSISKRIDVVPEIRYFLPNAFTPNFDSKNDDFLGIGLLEGIRDFKMIIWNRWGEQVFETNNPNLGWNGRKRNEGEVVQDGVYLYQVQFRGPRGNPFDFKGFVTLLK